MPQSADDPTNDLQAFVDNAVMGYYAPVSPGPAARFNASLAFKNRFPVLTELLSESRLSTLQTGKGLYHLHAWNAPNGEWFGWLCFEPGSDTSDLRLHPDHELMITCFGGIVDYWNAPPGLMNNLNEALSIQRSAAGFGGSEELFFKCVPDHCNGSIRPEDYFTFAFEANGDFFVYHVHTGKVLLIGFDAGGSNLTHVETYEDLVYTVDGVRDIYSWIETLAHEFLDKAKNGHD